MLAALLGVLCSLPGTAMANERCVSAPPSTLLVNVKDKGARGDGVSDDTKAIQAAVNQVSGTGGTVYVPDGVYVVDPVAGIRLQSHLSLRLSSNAVIRAKPSRAPSYSVVQLINSSNVSIVGGTIAGERAGHVGDKGEWGMVLSLRGVRDVVVEGVTIRDAWGDGIYVSNASERVTFCSVVVENNRRQGLSIISAKDVTIKNSIFRDTVGTKPEAGIDIEPNQLDDVQNVAIVDSQFVNNAGAGIAIYVNERYARAAVTGVSIKENTIRGNKRGGIVIVNSNQNQVLDNRVEDNNVYGIYFDKNTRNNLIKSNSMFGATGLQDDGMNSKRENSFIQR